MQSNTLNSLRSFYIYALVCAVRIYSKCFLASQPTIPFITILDNKTNREPSKVKRTTMNEISKYLK